MILRRSQKVFFLRLAKDAMWVKEGLAWVGWAGTLLDPKTVRTERHWFIFYMAIIIGHFSFSSLWRWPTRGAKSANAPCCAAPLFFAHVPVRNLVHVPNIKMDQSSTVVFHIIKTKNQKKKRTKFNTLLTGKTKK